MDWNRFGIDMEMIWYELEWTKLRHADEPVLPT